MSRLRGPIALGAALVLLGLPFLASVDPAENALAIDARPPAPALLARVWRIELAGPPAMFAAMATVRLPVTGEASPARAQRIGRWLAEAHRIETVVTCDSGALWLRIAAQAYNELAEYERLVAAIAAGALP